MSVPDLQASNILTSHLPPITQTNSQVKSRSKNKNDRLRAKEKKLNEQAQLIQESGKSLPLSIQIDHLKQSCRNLNKDVQQEFLTFLNKLSGVISHLSTLTQTTNTNFKKHSQNSEMLEFALSSHQKELKQFNALEPEIEKTKELMKNRNQFLLKEIEKNSFALNSLYHSTIGNSQSCFGLYQRYGIPFRLNESEQCIADAKIGFDISTDIEKSVSSVNLESYTRKEELQQAIINSILGLIAIREELFIIHHALEASASQSTGQIYLNKNQADFKKIVEGELGVESLKNRVVLKIADLNKKSLLENEAEQADIQREIKELTHLLNELMKRKEQVFTQLQNFKTEHELSEASSSVREFKFSHFEQLDYLELELAKKFAQFKEHFELNKEYWSTLPKEEKQHLWLQQSAALRALKSEKIGLESIKKEENADQEIDKDAKTQLDIFNKKLTTTLETNTTYQQIFKTNLENVLKEFESLKKVFDERSKNKFFAIIQEESATPSTLSSEKAAETETVEAKPQESSPSYFSTLRTYIPL